MALMDIDAVEWWTFDLVREALVEAAVLWRRSPKGGHAPLRTCWPVDLMVGERWDYDARGGLDQSEAPSVRPLPLSREEVERRDRVSGWLMLVGAEDVARYRRLHDRAVPSARERMARLLAEAEQRAAEDRRLLAACLEFHARGYTQLPWARVMRVLGVKRGKDGLANRYRASLRAIAEGLNSADFRASSVSRG